MPDWTRAARRPSEREEIVDYVFSGSAGTAEKDWLEWKTEYDLTTVHGRLGVARQVMSFANRHPDRAAQHAEGLGYLLLGVEPGNLPGVPEFDSADLENWLAPYIGPKIAWDPNYVSYHGKLVLFVTVEAPRWGDDLHCLRQAAEDYHGRTVREGTIWVRKLGKSEQATPADIDMLAERARAVGRTLSLSLEAKQPELKTLTKEVLSDGWREEVLSQLTENYLRSVPAHRELFAHTETRDPQDFRAEVHYYIAQIWKRWPSYVAAMFIEEEGCPLDLVVRNDTDQVYESLQVEARLPLMPGWTFLSAADARKRFKVPDPPIKWNKMLDVSGRLADVVNPALGSAPEIEEIQEDGHQVTLVRFPPLLVRPHSQHPLPTVYLVMPPRLAGQDFAVRWRATSSSTTGQCEGTLKLKTAEDLTPEIADVEPGVAQT